MRRAVHIHGLGMTVDLSVFDQLANLQTSYAPTVDVFTDAGSFWHVLLGVLTGAVDGSWPAVVATAFAGYEISKAGSGESLARIAGTLIEFAIGLGAATLLVKRRAR